MTKTPASTERYPWLWDVDMDNATFEDVLHGKTDKAGRDRDWAMLRLIEYAPYREVRRLLPLSAFLTRWPVLAGKVRSASRREGMDYFADRIKRRTPVHV